MSPRTRVWALIAATLPLSLVVLLGIVPLAGVIRSPPTIGRESLESIVRPAIHSLVLAATTASVSIVLAFTIASLLPRSMSWWSFASLTCALLPLLIGDLAAGFSIKVLAFDFHWLSGQDEMTYYVIALGMQLWQSVPICILVFYLRMASNDLQDQRELAAASRMAPWEHAIYVAWPACRGLAAVLVLFLFLRTMYETEKLQCVLAAGPGSPIQPIGHWIAEDFRVFMTTPRQDAIGRALALSSLVVVLSVAGTVITYYAANLAIPLIARLLLKLCASNDWIPSFCARAVVLASGPLCLFPVVMLLRRISPAESWVVRDVALSAIASLIVGLFCAAIAAAAGVLLRMAFPKLFATLSNRTALAFLAILFVQLVPPFTIGMLAFWWVVRTAGGSEVGAMLIWASAQVILATPLLTAFILATMMRLSDDLPQLLRAANATNWEVAHWAYLERLRPELALLAVFGVTLVWFEGAVSPYLNMRGISSLTEELLRQLGGRSADYSICSALITVSALPLIGSLLLLARRLCEGSSSSG